ncbi:MAG: TVP38/TMEM64 family protein [Spirochaetaceae bacterium]
MRRIGKSAAALLIIGAAVWLSVEYDLQGTLRDLLSWVEGQGAVGVITFIVAYIAATVLFIPGSILTLGAGFVFGVLEGVAYVSVASTLGATLAFLVGRYIAREWVSKKIAENPRFSALDRAVSQEGWKIVGLTRLSPIFPFNMLNYGYGITGVSLPSYFIASWIGMLPGTVMYVYLGSLAGSLATLGAREGRTTAEWVFYSVGLIATVVVTFYVTRIARRVLSDRVEIPVEEQ